MGEAGAVCAPEDQRRPYQHDQRGELDRRRNADDRRAEVHAEDVGAGGEGDGAR